MNAASVPCAPEALHRSLLEFWCRAHGWTLKRAKAGLAVIDHGFGDVLWTSEDLFAAVVRTAAGACDLAAVRALDADVYEVRHDPARPARFEIRTAAAAVGCGDSLAQAVRALDSGIPRKSRAAAPALAA